MTRDPREQIERDVWVPVKHPVSGERINVRSVACEGLVTPDEIAELEAHMAAEPPPNSPDDDGPEFDRR